MTCLITLADWKTLVDIGANLAKVLAILVGGFWTWLLFVKKRQRFPKATVTHVLTTERLPGHILLHVVTKIVNSGDVLLSLRSAEARVQQILPVTDGVAEKLTTGNDPVESSATEVEWPLVALRRWSWREGQAEVEPGEHEELHADFVLASSTEAVKVYSYVKNVAKKRRVIGWPKTTLFNLSRGSASDGVPG